MSNQFLRNSVLRMKFSINNHRHRKPPKTQELSTHKQYK